MIRNARRSIIAAILMAAALACGGDSTGPAPAPDPRTGTIQLLNQSNVSIVGVYFTTCDDDSWGANRLAQAETLAPGALRTWTVEAGCYDLKASTGSKSASWYDRTLAAGGALQMAVPASVATMMVP